MDLNKKHLLNLTTFLLFCNLSTWGQSINISGRVLNQSTQKTIEYANVMLFNPDLVFLKGVTTDSIGIFEFTNITSDNYILSVSCMGFEIKKILLQNLSEPVEVDVYLNESTLLLEEVVISASSTISKINQRIVFPTKLQLNHSANGIQLLNTMTLAGLKINPITNSISSSDGGKVILQINGANATPEEVQTLQPHQVKRIEYSDYTGIRFEGASKIINYIIERKDKGGVIGVDLMNSLNTLAGGDVFFIKYNKKKSEYSLNYTTVFQNNNTNNRTRASTYLFENLPMLRRDEVGDGGDYSHQMHDITLGYNYQHSDSVFFNAKVKYALTDQPNNDFRSNLKENGIDMGDLFDYVSQRITTPTIDLYYEHGLKNRQKIYANIVGSYVKAKTRRNYIEYGSPDTLFKERFNLFSNKSSVIAEGIYEKGFDYGTLKLGAKYFQSLIKQKIQQHEVFESDQQQAEFSIFTEWSYRKKNITYSIGFRGNRVHFFNNSIKKDYYSFLPKVMLGYRLNENSFIRYSMGLSQTNPSLLELTDTEIWLDPYLVEKGNASLKPYCNLNNNLFYESQKGLFTFNVNLQHHYKHNPIMESVKEQGNIFFTTFDNMRSWNKYNAETTSKIGMIKNILQLSLTGGYNHFASHGLNYFHSYSNFYYSASVLAMYKKWMFTGQLQPFEEQLYGETVTKKGNYHYLAVQYNNANLSFGFGAFNPFKNVSRTIIENKSNRTPFMRESFSSASQTIVATLTWNFSFGKTYNSGSKPLDNKDTDYGIKNSYK